MPIFSIKQGGRRVFGLNLAGAPWNVVFGKIYSIYTTNFTKLPTLLIPNHQLIMAVAPSAQLDELLRPLFLA